MVEGRGEGPGGVRVGWRTKMGEADTSENPFPPPTPAVPQTTRTWRS